MSEAERETLEAVRNHLQMTQRCLKTTMEGMKWNASLGLHTLEGRFDNTPSAWTTLDTSLRWIDELLNKETQPIALASDVLVKKEE